jgi:hypothetical protein
LERFNKAHIYNVLGNLPSIRLIDWGAKIAVLTPTKRIPVRLGVPAGKFKSKV